MSGESRVSAPAPERPAFMRFVRRFAVPILTTWLFMTVAVNVLVPPIESVAREHAVTMSPHDAPAMIAAKHIGQKYHESHSDSIAMIVLESDDPLGERAHQYYDNLVLALQADTRHVQHVQNVWGDPLTASGVQSRDGRAAYVQVNLAGDQGSTLGNKSVVAVREIVDNSTPPQGVTVYVTGPAALTTDMNEAADKSMLIMMGVTGAVIMIMLLITYRSVSTMLLVLVMVGFEMGTARGIVAILGNYDLLGFSTFVVAMLSSLAIAAGTDYAIFLIGRYQEARQVGQDRENAYYTMFRGTFHIILGSGLTIAGATLCLHLARLSYFKALGIPSALGLLVVVVGALTAAPAVVVVAGRFGLLDPKRPVNVRRWRRIGTATVRWPGAVFAASSAIALVGIAIMPTMKVSYNDRFYIPEDLPSNIGYTAAERHFSSATMNPDILMIESDHDMRNTGGHDHPGQDRQGGVPLAGNRDGAKYHPPLGRPHRAHLHPVPDQCPIDSHPAEPSIHEGPGSGHARHEQGPRCPDRCHGAHAVPAGSDEQCNPPHVRQHDGRQDDAGGDSRSPGRLR